ncbi:MAG: hypothetical protein JXR23_05900 [Pontiellaceae bacterium]|nr:hypothetical protein [Pontiellaceae bacterium]
MKTSKTVLITLLALCGAFPAAAQFGPRTQVSLPEGSIAPETNINQNGYPRIMPDLSVVFRVNAPQAERVQISLGKTYTLTKDESGTWTGKTDPQVPGFHYYSLIVDGVDVSDPASESFYGCSRVSSAIEIPEAGCDFYTIQDVPHGYTLSTSYYSEQTKSWRPLNIYLPPDYNTNSNKKYPVMYIHHGGGEDHRGWAEQGKTGIIMDNLIAKREAVPMIVVMPNSNLGIGGGGYNMQGMQPYKTELTEAIIPFVEKNFRAIQDRKSRAMCGLSMGGGQAFYIGLSSTDVFADVGIFSSGLFGGIREANGFDAEKEMPGLLSDSKSFNEKLDVLFISCGDDDPRIEPTKAAVEKMRAAGLEITFASYPSDHEWQTWRKSLHDFAPLLFH